VTPIDCKKGDTMVKKKETELDYKAICPTCPLGGDSVSVSDRKSIRKPD